MIKNSILALITGAFITAGVQAGEWCPPTPSKNCQPCPIDCCPEYQFNIHGGYHTDYIFRGFQLQEENWTFGADYTFGLGDLLGLPFGDMTLGYWSLNGLPNHSVLGEYHEERFYTTLAGPSVLGFGTSLNYTHYERNNIRLNNIQTNELGLKLSRDFKGATISYFAAHDLDSNQWYHELGIHRSIPITDCLALQFDTALGYWDNGSLTNGGFRDRGLAHRTMKLSLPFDLNCQMTITPYVGYVDSMQGGPTHRRATGAGGSHTHGAGASPDDQWVGGVNAGWKF